MVLWLNQVSVLQPILEQVHLREIVRDALQMVQGEEATVVASGRLVEVLVLNRLMAPRPLYRVGEWLQDSVLAHRLGLDSVQVNDARLGRLLDALDGVTATIWPQVVAHALTLGGTDLAAVYYDITSLSPRSTSRAPMPMCPRSPMATAGMASRTGSSWKSGSP
jgi:hypothetical protein